MIEGVLDPAPHAGRMRVLARQRQAGGLRPLEARAARARGREHLPSARTSGRTPLAQPNYANFGPDGTLYLSGSGAWGENDGLVLRLDVSGQATLLSAPTNVCFAGPNLGLLVSDNLGRWHLTAIETELHGLPEAMVGRRVSASHPAGRLDIQMVHGRALGR